MTITDMKSLEMTRGEKVSTTDLETLRVVMISIPEIDLMVQGIEAGIKTRGMETVEMKRGIIGMTQLHEGMV